MRSRFLAPLALALLALGCGGGSSPSPSAAPRLEVSWPARTRDVAAPVLAQAVRVVLTPSVGSATPVEAFFDRPSETDAAGLTQNCNRPKVEPGAYTLDVRFLVDKTPPHPALATATVSVKILRSGEIQRIDGTPLGTIATEGKVAGLYTQDTFVGVGETKRLNVSINLEGGGVLAAPLGTPHFTITGGGAFLRLNDDETFTGLGEGQATVVIDADGVSSAPKALNVLGGIITPRTVYIGVPSFFSPTPMVYDPTRGSLWGIGSSGVVEVDPVAGTVRRTISPPYPLRRIAISDDGAALYAAGRGVRDNGDVIVRTDLATGQVTEQFVPGAVPEAANLVIDFAVVPGRNDEVVVASHPDSQPDGPGIVELYRRSARLPNALDALGVGSLAWLSPTRLVYSASPLTLRAANADDQGLAPDAATGTLSGVPIQFAVADGRLYGSDGSMFDASTLAPVGHLPIADFLVHGIASMNGCVYVIYTDGDLNEFLAVYRTADLSFMTQRRLTTGAPGGAIHLVRWGEHGLAYESFGEIQLIDNPPSL